MTEAFMRRAWTDGEACDLPEATLPGLILAQARRAPDAVALRQWDRRLSYGGLAASTGRLAGLLRAAGVAPETRVGICVRRSLALPVAVVGVLRAGGVYVPLDPGHPRRRLDTIVDDAAVRVAVVDNAGRALLDGGGLRLIQVDTADQADPGPGLLEPDPGGPRPGNAAYVVYTSGSTGRPKGVVVTHRTVAGFAAAAARRLTLDAGCRSAGFSALGFDLSVLDLIIPLTQGGAVQFIPDEDRVDPARLERFLREHQVTTLMLPPAVLSLLDPAQLPGIAEVVAAGETCGPEQVARWSVPGSRRFHNWYGPTETTVLATGAELSGSWDRPLPVGRPLPGYRVYVLDERARPCPPGAVGELCIAGPQLARGYLGQPGQTAARFVPDPFSEAPGDRMYRTGDLGRWEPDGVLSFHGLLDRQVKIQGQRVEIGEIEVVLRAHPRVRQAVVDVATDSAGRKQLVAYLAPADGPDAAELRAYVGERLPPAMVPARVTLVAALPLNPSGKVDLAALRRHAADADNAAADTAGRAPVAATGVAGVVAAAWSEAFDSARPSPDDDFLASGGHSLLAMRLVSVLRARTGRQVAVEDVFAGRTLGGMIARVEAAPAAEAERLPAGSAPALSAAQRQMWFVEQLTPGVPVHNVAMAQRLWGQLDRPALRAALRFVATRHEVLRWRIGHSGGVPSVAVDPPADVPLPVDDLSVLPAAEREARLRAVLDHEARQPLVLAAGPPWRARLIRVGPQDHVLAITVHHIVFDGWSWHVLYRDLARGYRGEPAAADPPPAAFADYAARLARREEAGRRQDGSWWAGHLGGAARVLDLPRDQPRPPIQTFRGASSTLEIGRETTARIADLASRIGVTRYAVLLAAFGQLLRRLTGSRDFVIGVPVADRDHVAFESAIGSFLQVLPLRCTIDDELGLAVHARRCQDELAALRAHLSEPLGRIVETLGGQRDLSRNPLIQVLFNMDNFAEVRVELPGLTASPLPPGLPGALFDLTLYPSEHRDRLALRAVYNPDLYQPVRIDALLSAYSQLLGDLTRRPERPARDASMRPPDSGLPGADAPLARWDGPGVVERVRAVALARPEAVAATGPQGALRLRDVTEVSDRVAAAVLAAGVAPGDAVAVLGARDGRLPAVLLGVLASGARWVILDPALPRSVLARALRTARARALICCRAEDGGHLEPGTLPVIDAGFASRPGPERRAAGRLPAAVSAGIPRALLGNDGRPQGDPHSRAAAGALPRLVPGDVRAGRGGPVRHAGRAGPRSAAAGHLHPAGPRRGAVRARAGVAARPGSARRLAAGRTGHRRSPHTPARAAARRRLPGRADPARAAAYRAGGRPGDQLRRRRAAQARAPGPHRQLLRHDGDAAGAGVA